MEFDKLRERYRIFLSLERALSDNTLDGYLRDVDRLHAFALEIEKSIENLTSSDLRSFLRMIYELGISERTLARILSGVKSFYRFSRT